MRTTISRSKLFYSTALFTLLAPLVAAAQVVASGQAASPDEAGSAAANALPQVVVTANRTPVDIDQVGQSITVLTQADIRLDQETAVSDILARTPGVSFTRNGGPGATTSLFIRGAESAQTVVLIDGVKVNDPSDPGASYDFANLASGDIARIEVLRGPQSTLYGSEAIGGVINVITADATKPLQGDAQIEGGSYGTAYAKGAIGGKADKFDWRIGAYYDTTDGVSAFDKAFGGKEDDGSNSAGVSGHFRYDLTRDLQVDQRVYYTNSRDEFDGYDTPSFNFGDDAEFGRVQQVVDYTGLNLSLLNGQLKNRLAFEYNGLDRRDEDPDQPETKFTFLAQGQVTTVEYEGDYAIAPGYQAVFGAQSERSTINARSPYYDLFGDLPTKANVTVNSGYGQIVGEVLPGLTLTGGLRYDDNSAFGDHTTEQASAAWKLNGGNTILRASFGQGFKAPSLYELYSEYGNAVLRPETSNGWDAGIEQHFLNGRVVVQATYFGRETKNLIDFVSCYGVLTGACAQHQTFGGYYDNVDRADAEGVELQGSWQASDRLSFTANYTYDDVEDRSPGSPTYGLQLARRPKNAANLSGAYLWPIKLRTEVAVRYAGESFNDDAHYNALKGYTLVDLRASYPLRDNLELYGRIENLTDQHYEVAYQYGTLGRAAYGGVRVSF
jgi:vitamin B12 transporter